MPTETSDAISWSFKQHFIDDGIEYKVNENGKVNSNLLVDFVREYFNNNNIEYETFNFNDLKRFL